MIGQAGRRVGAYDRLQALPAVFALHDIRVGIPHDARHGGAEGLGGGAERVALSRWTARGLVMPAGPKLGRYYNLVADPRGPDAHLGAVLRAEFGSVVIVGPSVLADAGWTTQTDRILTVAVPAARSYPRVDGAEVYGRQPEWFAAVRRDVRKAGRGRFGLAVLPPELALADALRHGDCLHGLAPDDIEIPEGEVNPDDFLSALSALDVPVDRYEPYLRASGIRLASSGGPAAR